MDDGKKNGLSEWKDILYLCVLLFVVLMIIGVTIMTAVSFYKILSAKEQVPVEVSVLGVEFTLLLTGLTVFIAGSILMPKVLLEHEVQEAVERYAADEIQNKAKTCVDSKVQDAKNDNMKTDAHLSRMIAFGLTEKFPVWSIGWAFRSLKRYVKLDAKKIGFKEYRDFIEFIQTAVIEKSSNIFLSSFDIENESDYSALFEKIRDEALKSNEKNVFRPSIRAIKDIADFEYMVLKGKYKSLVDYRSLAENVCKSAGIFARILATTIMQEKYKQSQSVNENDKDTFQPLEEWLLNEILEISDFGFNSENIEDTKNYKESLLKVLVIVSPKESMNSNKERGDFFFMRSEEK